MYKMATVSGDRTFSDVQELIISAHKSTSAAENLKLYNNWAPTYEQDVEIVEYRAPVMAAQCLASVFPQDQHRVQILDVACGTGLVTLQLKKYGFGTFHGMDGCEAMLKVAREKGLYQDLKHCILGKDPLPAATDCYDAVVVAGALSDGHVPYIVVPELCRVTKPGGYVCMTIRTDSTNTVYLGQFEALLKQLEQKGLWEQVIVQNEEKWEKAVSESDIRAGSSYIPGILYLYRKSAN